MHRNPETPVVKEIQLNLSRGDVRLWRNNVGEAWAGKGYATPSGGIVIPDPYRVNFGLCTGSGDLIGYRAVTITQDMVGCSVAVFTSLEVKKPHGRIVVKSAQKDFIQLIQSVGGIADVVRSTEDAKKALNFF
jgi:hypothetical protein